MASEDKRPVEHPAPSISTDEEFLRRLREGIGIGLVRAAFTFVLAVSLIYETIPSFYYMPTRPRVARLRSDMRSMSVALEAYRQDNNLYPPGKPYWGVFPSSLSTPVAYVIAFPTNPFSERVAAYNSSKMRVFLAISSPGVGLMGVVILVGAVAVFRIGKGTRRYGIVLTFGYVGFSWAVLSLLWGLALWQDINVATEYPITMLQILFWASFPGLLAFGSGMRKAMKGAPWWSPPLLVQALILAVWIGLGAASDNASAALARYEVGRRAWETPNDQNFLYATDGKNGWIIWSCGPDGLSDLPGAKFPRILQDSSKKELWDTLFPLSYDPTNGTISRGDIWRINQ